MALTVTQLDVTQTAGGFREAFATVTFDSSYATNGLAFDPTTLFPGIQIVYQVTGTVTNGGRIVQYDATNKKLKAFQNAAGAGAFAEVPNATNLSTEITTVRVVGK